MCGIMGGGDVWDVRECWVCEGWRCVGVGMCECVVLYVGSLTDRQPLAHNGLPAQLISTLYVPPFSFSSSFLSISISSNTCFYWNTPQAQQYSS